jgi:hypothetical protein
MNTPLTLVVLSLTVAAFAQQRDDAHSKGAIYGVAIGQDGQPAKGIGLTATPLGVPLVMKLPHAKTNQTGAYRFEHLGFGSYTVYADDNEAGYSIFSNGSNEEDSHPVEVELTVERPEAEFRVNLPPPAGFLEIYLTNQKTGASISAMRVELTQGDEHRSVLFRVSCYSNHVVLIPPDRNVLLHVSSDGFRERQESVGTGRPIYLPSGTRLKLDVQLAPHDE